MAVFNRVSASAAAPARRHHRLVAPLVVAAVIATGLASLAPSAYAAGCTTSWTGTGDGLWTNAANWSNGAPDASKDVCIGDVTTGTYSVTLNTSGQAKSISIGGTIGTQTLIVGNQFGSLTLSDPSSIGANGVLNLDLSYGNASSVLAGSTLTNGGKVLVTGIISAGHPYLRSNIVNNGTVDVQAPGTVIDSGVTLTNNGTTKVASGASVVVSDGASFVNTAGTLTNCGTFTVAGGSPVGKFTQDGGTVTGNDPVINGGNWNGIGAGAGSFTVLGTSSLSGAIAVGQTVRIDDAIGNGIVSIPTSFTNAGTLVMDMTYGNANTILQPSTATVTNTGTLRVTGVVSAGRPYLRSNIVNNGTMDFQAPETVIDSGVTLTNNSTTKVASGASVVVRDGASFVNTAGTLTNSGTFTVAGGSPVGKFTQDGGTVTGNDPVINGGNWNGIGAGAGSFTVLGTSSLSGAIAVAQTVRIASSSAVGNGITTIPSSFTNAGTLVMDMAYGNANTILQPAASGATLLNTGTFEVTGIQSAGTHSLRVDVTNNGLFILNKNAVLDFRGAFTQGSGGTTQFDLASAAVFGRMVASGAGSATLAGTANPVFVDGYSSPLNATFAVITAPHTGDFGIVTNSFGSDVTNPSFVRLVSGVNPFVAPLITSVNASTFTIGTAKSFTVTATGTPTPTISSTGALPSGVTFTNGVLSGTPAAGTTGTYPLTIRATNAVNPDATQAFTLTVVAPSVAPSITSANASTFTIGTAKSFTVTATGTPTPTISSTGALPSGVTFTNGVLSGTPAAGTTGTYPLTIRATNAVNPDATQAFTLTVVAPSVAPSITSANASTFTIGTAKSFTVTATGTPTPTISSTGALPSGVTFVNGVLSGTPAAGTTGTYPLTVGATNGVNPDASQAFTLTVVAPSVAPSITSANASTFTIGTTKSFTVTATGTPTPTISSTGTLPTGVTFANGVLSGTPAAGTAGTYPLTIGATNAVNPDATQTFMLTVVAPSVAPSITSVNATTFTIGTSGSFTVRATGTPTPTISSTGTLPTGVTFANGVLSGTPAAGTAGTYPLTIRATNGVNPDATQAFTFRVVSAPGVAPRITSASSVAFPLGTPGSFTVTATGSPAPTISLTGTLPSGVTFVNGVLSGTPAGPARSYTLMIRATNGVNPDAIRGLTLNVVSVSPRFTSDNSTTFTAGIPGSFTVTATGSPTPTISALGLPSGLTFVNGVLSGTPASAPAGLRLYFLFRASNGDGRDAYQLFSLTVLAPDLLISIPTTAATNTGVTYGIGVRNRGGAPSSGTVTVRTSYGRGITFDAFVGARWSCSDNPATRTLTCTTPDSIAPGASAPPLAISFRFPPCTATSPYSPQFSSLLFVDVTSPPNSVAIPLPAIAGATVPACGSLSIPPG